MAQEADKVKVAESNTSTAEPKEPEQEALLGTEKTKPGMCDVLKAFLPIGFLSFGGTAANMALLMSKIVEELKWCDKTQYSELLGLSQSLPGPSAVQILLLTVTMATGRPSCGVVAALCFLIPAGVVMALIGLHLGEGSHMQGVVKEYQDELKPLEGCIGCAAIALVAGGALELGQKLIVDGFTKGVWLCTALCCFASAVLPGLNAGLTLACLGLSGIAGVFWYPSKIEEKAKEIDADAEAAATGISRPCGHILFWGSWALLPVFFVWPLFAELPPLVAAIAPFYNVGVLVFGGGPVVIPLLLFQLVSNKLVTTSEFSLGFAVVQLMPGPMFNLSGFCGALRNGVLGAVLAWTAMIVPGITMALGALPFYTILRKSDTVQRGLKGVNAAAAGLMGAALLLLWKTVVGTSSPRICLCLSFIGAQQILGVKAYWMVLLGLTCGTCLMVAGWYMGETIDF